MAVYRFSHKDNSVEEAKMAAKMVKKGAERICEIIEEMEDEYGGFDERGYSQRGYSRRGGYGNRDWDERDWEEMEERRMRNRYR